MKEKVFPYGLHMTLIVERNRPRNFVSLSRMALLFSLLVSSFVTPVLGRQHTNIAPKDSLPSDAFIQINGGLKNFYKHVVKERQATVAFLGGSITAGKGWRDHVEKYLKDTYPETEWTFINAGIPSLGSVPHSFRLASDVLSKGRIDLLFIESAVNDLANGTPVLHQRRALEGIVRHARRAQPGIDIVLMAFADEVKNDVYAAGGVPEEVQVHENVAAHYGIPFINLAREVFERIRVGEFTWKEDFIDLHPSPFGHRLYFRSIRWMFEHTHRISSSAKRARKPRAIQPSAYSHGQYVSVDRATIVRGFTLNPSWEPTDHAKARNRFVKIPVLEATEEGSTLELTFRGDAVGIAVLAGPDAGIIGFSIDGGPESKRDLYTQWSKSLHLPWYLILADGLKHGEHRLKLTLSADHNIKASGSACRIAYFLVNGSGR